MRMLVPHARDVEEEASSVELLVTSSDYTLQSEDFPWQLKVVVESVQESKWNPYLQEHWITEGVKLETQRVNSRVRIRFALFLSTLITEVVLTEVITIFM